MQNLCLLSVALLISACTSRNPLSRGATEKSALHDPTSGWPRGTTSCYSCGKAIETRIAPGSQGFSYGFASVCPHCGGKTTCTPVTGMCFTAEQMTGGMDSNTASHGTALPRRP